MLGLAGLRCSLRSCLCCCHPFCCCCCCRAAPGQQVDAKYIVGAGAIKEVHHGAQLLPGALEEDPQPHEILRPEVAPRAAAVAQRQQWDSSVAAVQLLLHVGGPITAAVGAVPGWHKAQRLQARQGCTHASPPQHPINQPMLGSFATTPSQLICPAPLLPPHSPNLHVELTLDCPSPNLPPPEQPATGT